MPHQLVLRKYLSSKKFRLQSNTVHAFQREICCNNTFRESYSLQRRNSILEIRQTLQNRKNSRAYLYTRTRDKSGSNSPPFQGNVQIPPSPGTMPGLCPRGMLKLQFDRYIISYICDELLQLLRIRDGLQWILRDVSYHSRGDFYTTDSV